MPESPPSQRTVKQVDRDRAAPFFRTDWAREEALAGKRDDDPRVIAFAAHRKQAAAEVRNAAQALLDKLDVALPKINGILDFAAIHHCPYDGPVFGDEIEALRTALQKDR